MSDSTPTPEQSAAEVVTPIERILELHPLPWTNHSLLIKDAEGRQVIHLGGMYGERNQRLEGKYLSGLNALIVEAVNTRVRRDVATGEDLDDVGIERILITVLGGCPAAARLRAGEQSRGTSDVRSIIIATLSAARPPVSEPTEGAEQSFQSRVQPWMMECFGVEISADKQERNHRFLEEALELVQACGCSQREAHQLVDYVYGRNVGEPSQEVGGVMVTLAALCLAQGFDMHQSAETELARIWTKVDVIRSKQAAKPKNSPLPEVTTSTPATVDDAVREAAQEIAARPTNMPPKGPLSQMKAAFELDCIQIAAIIAKHLGPREDAPLVTLLRDRSMRSTPEIKDGWYGGWNACVEYLLEVTDHHETIRPTPSANRQIIGESAGERIARQVLKIPERETLTMQGAGLATGIDAAVLSAVQAERTNTWTEAIAAAQPTINASANGSSDYVSGFANGALSGATQVLQAVRTVAIRKGKG